MENFINDNFYAEEHQCYDDDDNDTFEKCYHVKQYQYGTHLLRPRFRPLGLGGPAHSSSIRLLGLVP